MSARGFTLVELLISMSLSLIIISALVPISLFSLRSTLQIQNTEKQINLLSQALKVIEADLKSTALTGCALDKRLIINSLFSDERDITWLSGYSDTGWFPQAPEFVNQDNARSFDALQLVKTDMSGSIPMAALTKTPGRVVFVTNCLVSEISRASESRLITQASSGSEFSIFELQFIQYYIKQNQGKYSLYRQYLTQSGTPRNEPMVDNIDRLVIGYAERLDGGELAINTAANVANWNNITAVYIFISLKGALGKTAASLVMLENHAR